MLLPESLYPQLTPLRTGWLLLKSRMFRPNKLLRRDFYPHPTGGTNPNVEDKVRCEKRKGGSTEKGRILGGWAVRKKD